MFYSHVRGIFLNIDRVNIINTGGEVDAYSYTLLWHQDGGGIRQLKTIKNCTCFSSTQQAYKSNAF